MLFISRNEVVVKFHFHVKIIAILHASGDPLVWFIRQNDILKILEALLLEKCTKLNCL